MAPSLIRLSQDIESQREKLVHRYLVFDFACSLKQLERML
jgi:hypothetical protein